MKRKMMDTLLKWKEQKGRKPLLIKGVRQVGKTHLLKEFGKLHFAQELLCKSDSLFSWQENKAEIEFLMEINGNVIPIEVKSGLVTKAKRLKVFAEKYHPLYQIVFSARPLSIGEDRKIHYYPLYLAGLFQ